MKILTLLLAFGLSACAQTYEAIPETPVKQAMASYYHEGQRVACPGWGRFNPNALTTAHRSLPCGTKLKVCRGDKMCVVVTVNDRGPAKWTKRDIDLSLGAARTIGLTTIGVALVNYQIIK